MDQRYLGGGQEECKILEPFGMLCSFFIDGMLWSSKSFISQGAQKTMVPQGHFNT
jgi:hypothetical protein